MDVTVIVGTYGGAEWPRLAEARAIPSVPRDVFSVHVHANTLHDARNEGALQATTEWLCFLDADDELEPGYFDTMSRATADLRAPAVRYIRNGRPDKPRMPQVAGHTHACEAACLPAGNWLVIGSLIRRELFMRVGGFRDFAWSEDWDLWLRCHLAGATFESVPGAVYRAHMRPRSRNRPPVEDRLRVHFEIAAANGLVA